MIAPGWTAAAPARIVFSQDIFLLTLGFGVALWRALTAVALEAELMAASASWYYQ